MGTGEGRLDILYYLTVHSQRMTEAGYTKTAWLLDWAKEEIKDLREKLEKKNEQ